MSRGVRDLRELICVSRLTFCASDDERVLSDDDAMAGDFDRLSISSNDSVGNTGVGRHLSPDSGCVTNGSTPPEVPLEEDMRPIDSPVAIPVPTPPPTVKIASKVGNVRRKKKRVKNKILDTAPTKHDLPKPPRLPPVLSRSMSGGSSPDEDLDVDIESRPENGSFVRNRSIGRFQPKTQAEGNFDDILCFMDATIVANWLTRANEIVNELIVFCNCGENFVNFAHFWLSGFQDCEKVEIFELEHGILSEELSFAFAVGKDQRKVTQRDILNLIKALFREYPGRLLSGKGPHLFLNYLDILSSQSKHSQYKKLLSDVKCSTKNKQYAQWILATRSFALVSVWFAVINFFRNLLGLTAPPKLSQSSLPSSKEINLSRFSQAIRLGHVDVVHYFLVEGILDVRHVDSHGRTFVFTAVMYCQNEVLKYLINRVKPALDVNLPADTGNSPLHAAANSGHEKIVETLLQCPSININQTNPQCDNATPLHLAVMHGHRPVVSMLIKANADTDLKMGDLTAEDIAREFGSFSTLAVLPE